MGILYSLFAACFCVAVLEFILLLAFKYRLDTEKQKYRMEAASHRITQLKLFQAEIKNHESSEIMIEAVRYAAIKSHPDNGGSADDFVKFNQCYKELKKGRKGNTEQ